MPFTVVSPASTDPPHETLLSFFLASFLSIHLAVFALSCSSLSLSLPTPRLNTRENRSFLGFSLTPFKEVCDNDESVDDRVCSCIKEVPGAGETCKGWLDIVCVVEDTVLSVTDECPSTPAARMDLWWG